jgi:MEDS: MEthanogen/methylotroph, DcmR Sensory domain
MRSPWEKLLERPHPGGHFVQLYESDESALMANVGRYMWEGLRRGEGVLVIAAEEHRRMFSHGLESLGADISDLLKTRQLVLWDAQQTLQDFMVSGQPDWELFEVTIRAAMRQVRPQEGVEELRAYGEMVGILWKARQYAAAIRIEQLWNKLLERSSFSLYCAYEIDLFGRNFDLCRLEGVLSTHSHLLPGRTDGMLERSLYRSMQDILGPDADRLRVGIKANHRPSWAVMPSAERIVLWLRKNLPEEADRILQHAAAYYRGAPEISVSIDGLSLR